MEKMLVSPSPQIRDNISTSKVMTHVLVALCPALAMSACVFGGRALMLTGFCMITALIWERLCNLIMKRPDSTKDVSALVTGMLLAFNLPVTMPYWQAAIGTFVAIVIVKQLFGGLGQNFAKAFDVQFVNKENKLEYVWATSWGVSTRLMGALIMTHSDDNGLVLPPHLAPIQVVIIPIYKNDEQLKQIDAKVAGIVTKLKALGISVKYDNADNKRPGFKFADYELKGVPVRLVMGGRDLENNTMEVMRRDTLEKETITCEGIEAYVQNLLEEIQANIYKKALDYRNSKITVVDTYEEFKEKIEEGGFILAHWDGTTETEEKIKEETKATIRCIPFESFVPGDKEPGKCMVTGKPSACRVIFARSY